MHKKLNRYQMKKKVLIYPALMAALAGLSVNAASAKSAEPEADFIDIFSTGHPVLQSMLNAEAKAEQEKAQQESEENASLAREKELEERAAEEEKKKKEQEISDLQKALHFSEFLLRMRKAPILIGEIKGNEYSDAFPNGPEAERESETEPDSESESGPAAETEPAVESESGPATETEPVIESESETESGEEAGREAESEPASVTETGSEEESEPEPETKTGSEKESEQASETMPAVESESETGSESETESEPESGNEAGRASGPETGPETETGSEAESDEETETAPDRGAESGSEADTEAETETESTDDPLTALNPELAEAFRTDLGGLVADAMNETEAETEAESAETADSEEDEAAGEKADAGRKEADSDSKKPVSGGKEADSDDEETASDRKNAEADAGILEESETEWESVSASDIEVSSEAESEIIFTPVEMGSGINTTIPLPEETDAAVQEAAAVEAGAEAQEPSPEGSTEAGGESRPETDPNAAGESEAAQAEVPAQDIRPRHAAIAVPQIQNMNSARICLYDYRMLRSYPLAVLPKDMHILYDQIRETVSVCDGTWSVYIGNLSTGQALVVGDRPMKSASVMKLFIMAAVYDQIDQGNLERTEETVSLIRSMITDSSNEAANRLLLKLGDGSYAEGVAAVNRFVQLHGYSSGTHEYNGFQDSSSYVDPSHFNQIMAKDIGLLLSRVYYREFISRSVCNEIESMMLDQKTRYKIPKGIPEGILVGNKTGEMDSVQNDAAVIYGRNVDFVVVVLSMDVWDKDAACQDIQEISRIAYDFFED